MQRILFGVFGGPCAKRSHEREREIEKDFDVNWNLWNIFRLHGRWCCVRRAAIAAVFGIFWYFALYLLLTQLSFLDFLIPLCRFLIPVRCKHTHNIISITHDFGTIMKKALFSRCEPIWKAYFNTHIISCIYELFVSCYSFFYMCIIHICFVHSFVFTVIRSESVSVDYG